MTTTEAPPTEDGTRVTKHMIKRSDAKKGDTKVEWSPDNPAEVAAARGFFMEMKAKNYLAYSVDEDGNRAEVIKSFDKNAATIIMSPQLVGG